MDSLTFSSIQSVGEGLEYVSRQPTLLRRKYFDVLPMIRVGEDEYALGTEELVKRALPDAVRDALASGSFQWEFLRPFVTDHYGDTEIQWALAHDWQAAWRMVSYKDEFIAACVQVDGRGTYLSTWDGEEYTLEDLGMSRMELSQDILDALGLRREDMDTTIYAYIVHEEQEGAQ
jgi:hypothetical protein